MMILVIGADSELDDKYPEIHLRERHCGIVIVAGAVEAGDARIRLDPPWLIDIEHRVKPGAERLPGLKCCCRKLGFPGRAPLPLQLARLLGAIAPLLLGWRQGLAADPSSPHAASFR
jgi:hypothetical protein